MAAAAAMCSLVYRQLCQLLHEGVAVELRRMVC
jgi:hypothetical protein